MTRIDHAQRVPTPASRARRAPASAPVFARRPQAAARTRQEPPADTLATLLQRCVAGRCDCGGTRPTAAADGAPRAILRKRAESEALGGLLQRSVAARAPQRMLARLSESDCAPKDRVGLLPDAKAWGKNPTKWTLTIAVDREAKNRLGYVLGDVGHTWIKLSHDKGEKWSFGMWPQQYFNPLKPGSPVKGCVHHPDQAHEPPNAVEYKEITYDLNEKQYEDALGFAMDECERRPDYNLLYYNCTHFAIETAKQARVKPPSADTMSVPNPNAIFQGIEEEEQAKDQEDVKGRGRAQAFVEEEFVEPANVRWRGGALARPNPIV